jgi:serine/threonine protein kinase
MRNNTHANKKINKNNISRKKTRGGKAIDAGSYGCVFKPALKCDDNNKIPYNENNISKLMFKKDGESEIKEIKKIEQYIKNIPNNEKYFLVANTYTCNPAPITQKEDLKTFDEKCGLFTKRDIDSYNVNENLNKLELINMPNGGLSIERFVLRLLEMPDKYITFIKLNNALIQLLINGIVPINKLGVNHFDVKSANILFSPDGNARLIDWGLAGNNDGVTIPDEIKDRSFAFNMPFSDVLFNSYIKKWLPDEFNKIKASRNFRDSKDGQKELLKVIAVNLINKSIQETSDGHYDYITSNILHDIYKIYADRNSYNRLDYNVLTYNVLIEYIQAVLMNFVDDNGNFDSIKYFYEVFSPNADVWGFILTYAPFIEDGYGKLHKDIINGICRILLKYCFSPEYAIKVIDINELVADLTSLNDIAQNLPHSNMPTMGKRVAANMRAANNNNKPAIAMPLKTKAYNNVDANLFPLKTKTKLRTKQLVPDKSDILTRNVKQNILDFPSDLDI